VREGERSVIEQRKSRFNLGSTETLLVVGWFVGIVAFHTVSKWSSARGTVSGECWFGGRWVACNDWRFLLTLFLLALEQLLTPINILISVVVVYGILGLRAFLAGLRGKRKSTDV